ncbi:copper resistance protein [Shigella boydii]|nr:copper resistance protein [Shigella boydii]
MSNYWGALQNDGHYFCGAGGNRPDGSDESLTKISPAFALICQTHYV